MKKIEWTANDAVVKENGHFTSVTVDNDTFHHIVSGKWITDDLFELFKQNRFKLLLVNLNGDTKAVRTYGTQFVLCTGNVLA